MYYKKSEYDRRTIFNGSGDRRVPKRLISEERSTATVEKYIRNVKAFTAYAQDGEITKETVIGYKKHLQECYAVRSINSMLTGSNKLFTLLRWHDQRLCLLLQTICGTGIRVSELRYFSYRR